MSDRKDIKKIKGVTPSSGKMATDTAHKKTALKSKVQEEKSSLRKNLMS